MGAPKYTTVHEMASLDVWKSQGLIGDFDVRELVDASFAEQAVSRLGPYQPR